MYRDIKILIIFMFLKLGFITNSSAQCPYPNSTEAPKIPINYSLSATLDAVEKKVIAHENVMWTNISDEPVSELRFYMYMNAFKNMESTFLKGSGGVIFGSDITKRSANEWGYITISKPRLTSEETDTLIWKYIQPDDGNKGDESVLQMILPKAILPGESVSISMDFISKLPKFIARAGYSRDDYYAFLHWFPQLGVFEKNKNGQWEWNCHQFFRQTEFFADFANYEVKLTLPQHLVVGASGCITKTLEVTNKKQILNIKADDVIDFAWIAYPNFVEHRSDWKGVEIKLLIPPEHGAMADRYLNALKNALDFFEEKIGKYPYPSITLVDPPMHGLGSGFMEYPMLITCASFHYVPKSIRTIESLAVHEFSHQFFMAILASNEKEEAWMDEGFVNFFEDEIMDYYGGRKSSMFDIFGYNSGNMERSRSEYTSLPLKEVGPLARPGWEFNEGHYKGLVYAKTSLVLQTLKGLVGEKTFYQIMRHYYDTFKFKHPKEKDFIQSVKDIIGDTLIMNLKVDDFFVQTLHGTGYCDYLVEGIEESNNQNVVWLKRNGSLIIPVEIKVNFEDNSIHLFEWDGKIETLQISVPRNKKIKSVIIDPDHKVYLDINFNNNSFIQKTSKRPPTNYAIKSMTWLQHLLQTINFLI